ncbi:hypothetical protein [Stappia sp. MMSF_3263]|uniref:hypothetical protein n=1 Tax=Stappia sp. MMSF_3263 TaxID=3046693 RepID=UPI00273D9EE1|nr:hypothetical protein [Stappia sp. MMSF_3263]
MAQVTASGRRRGTREDGDRKGGNRSGLARKLAWFAVLWLAGVTVLTVVAGAIRWAIL